MQRNTTMALTIAAAALAAPQALAQGVGWFTTIEGSPFYNQSWPGGDGFTVLGTGQYQVVFPGLGNGTNSDVQVTAVDVGGQPHYCTTAGWGSSNGTDVIVDVDCFDAGGNLLNADFNVFYQTRSAPPPAGSIAFLWADQPTASSYIPSPTYSYNSTGLGANSITRLSTGVYDAFLPGLFKLGGDAQVTAYGSGAAHCETESWSPNRSGTNVIVACFDAGGNAADEYFDLSFTIGATEAAGASTSLGGYAWASQPTATGLYIPSKPYDFDNVSAHKLSVDNIGGGTSFLNLYVPKSVLFHTTLGMVSAYGSAGEFCDYEGLGYYGTAKNETLTLTVGCFDKNGNAVDAYYDGTIMASQ